MAPRANWKGFLRLSLVTCPWRLSGHLRVREDLVQPVEPADRAPRQVPEGRRGYRDEVPNEDIVKGYQLEKDYFIEVKKEELEKRWNPPAPSRSTSLWTGPIWIRAT